MIGPVILAGLAVLALAAGTPRQALRLSSRLTQPRRQRLRVAGLVLLGGSLACCLTGADRARHLVGWIGMTGLEALAVGAAFALIGGRGFYAGEGRRNRD